MPTVQYPIVYVLPARHAEWPRAGLFFPDWPLNGEPQVKRAVAFVDGQNLFHSAREAFGYTYPNYDASALAREVCARQGWECTRVRFYTEIPDVGDNRRWHFFWTHKLATMGRQGVFVYSRPLRYRNRTVALPDGTQHSFLTGEEKGIDVRIALDVIALAHRRENDVALIISQDQDLSEVAEEIRAIARQQRRWIKVASAFPQSPASRNRRGINKTDWIRIDQEIYDQCLDRRDYRRKSESRSFVVGAADSPKGPDSPSLPYRCNIQVADRPPVDGLKSLDPSNS